MSFSFTQAKRYTKKLRLAIYGPSGSGKTFTALGMACYIAKRDGKRVAVIDTENGSSSLYSGGQPYDFDIATLEPPYNPDRFVALMNEVAQASDTYSTLVIDSGSHAWSGEGGILDIKEQYSRRRNSDSFRAWAEVTPMQNRFVEAIISSPLHIIFTMRAKTQYAMERSSDTDKLKVSKIGTGYVQRDGMDYEFDMTWLMNQDHYAEVDKTRFLPFAGQIFKEPGDEVFSQVYDWINGEGEEDPYKYGDGTEVPLNAATRRIFNEYVSSEGSVPENSEELRAWAKGNQ